MIVKSDRLIRLVKGKILLRDAPTRRDVILGVYGLDIDDPKTKDWDRYFANRNFTALLRSVRNREEENTKDKDGLHYHNDCQFYMVQDENTKVWHCVHIIQQINGHYLLKWGKALQKGIETSRMIAERTIAAANMSEELREQMRVYEVKQRRKEELVKQYCTQKHIRSYIRELRKEGKLPSRKEYHTRNYKGIQHVFGENAAEIVYVAQQHMQWLRGSRLDQRRRMTYPDAVELIKNMTKDIILCDYLKQDYHRPEPQEADYLGIRK